MSISGNQMTNIEQLADEYGLFLCVGCGKCVAVCPMGEIFNDFSYEVSPRGVIEEVLADGAAAVLHADWFWFCLTCDLCTDLCPAGVRFRDFIEALRGIAIEAGLTEHSRFCRNCGKYLWPRHTEAYVKQKLGEETEELITLCPICRKYDYGKKLKEQVPGNRKVNPQEATTTEVS
jgi:ferredoxin